MNKMTRMLAMAFLIALAACTSENPTGQGGSSNASPVNPSQSGSTETFKVLVFSKTGGFRHYSIPVGVQTIESLGRGNNFEVVATESTELFTPEGLSQFAAVVWLNTTAMVLDTQAQRQAFEDYIRNGGGFVGVHAAADTEYEWPFYGELVAARFKCHPLQQLGKIINEEKGHPSTAHLPATWTVFDEFYSFTSNPRGRVNVLLSIDESSYFPNPNTSYIPSEQGFKPVDGRMGDHPMAWCHTNLGGVAWYTALGHEPYLYLLPQFQEHLLKGILIAARQLPADCSAKQKGQSLLSD